MTTQNSDATFPVWVLEKTLTDGSKVYNVEIGGQTVAANSEDDAYELAEAISQAIEEHTNTNSWVEYA